MNDWHAPHTIDDREVIPAGEQDRPLWRHLVPMVRFLVEERGHLLINGPEKFGFVGMQSSYVCSLTRVITDDDWQALNERFVIPDNIGFFKGLIQDNENGCDIVGTEWVGLADHRQHVDDYEAELRAEGRGGCPSSDEHERPVPDVASVNPPPPSRPVVEDEADGPGLPPPDPMVPVRMQRVPSLDRRLFAKAVDSVVYFFLFGFVMVGLGEIWGHDFDDPDALPSVGLVLAWEGVFLLAAFAYETVFVAKFGATVGKLVTGMRVVHEDDAVLPTWRSAAIRAGVPVVGVLFLIVGLFVVWGSVILDPGYRRQGWHDKLAHTVVVPRR